MSEDQANETTHLLDVESQAISREKRVIKSEKDQYRFFFKETVRFDVAYMFKQQCESTLGKHRLAAIHLAYKQFWIFTIPMALLAMASGILAFLATANLFDDRTNQLLNVYVGTFAFIVVFLQTPDQQLKFDTRADMHEAAAIELRDLRDELQNIIIRSGVMMRDRSGIAGGDDEEEESLKQMCMDIQQKYGQCLKSCKSTVPMPINNAFDELDTRLDVSLTYSGHKKLCDRFGENYHNKLFFQAYNNLNQQFTSTYLWPLRLPNAEEAVNNVMKHLRNLDLIDNSEDSKEDSKKVSKEDGCFVC